MAARAATSYCARRRRSTTRSSRRLGDGAGNKFYTEDNNFDVGDTVTHTNANTQTNSIFNLTYATLAGDVVTAVLGVESTPVGFDCEIFGTAFSAAAP